ncbi:MAG: DNA polymerase III subunit beta [Candidatus Kapabacteria bacterium]|nr:DNA polymerase III subunit beta [Candidatus Kapabacteria bacterium]
MKFTVSVSDFRKALQQVSSVIPVKTTIIAYEHILASLEGNTLQLIGSDPEATIITSINVSGEDDGQALFPAKSFVDTIKALSSEGSITVQYSSIDNFISVTTFNGMYKIKGMDAVIYPEIPTFDTESAIPFKAGVLQQIAKKTTFAVSKDQYRLSMTGVFFQFEPTKLLTYATDGYRLSRYTLASEENEAFPEGMSFIVPERIMKLIEKSETETVLSVNSQRTHIRCDMGTTTFISRLIDEKFPPCENVIPKENTVLLKVSLDDIVNSIKRIVVLANQTSKQMKFSIKNDVLVILSEDADSGNNASESIPCELQGFEEEIFDIGFNYTYLLEALQNLSSNEIAEDGTIVMTFSTPTKAALIKPSEQDNTLLMLVMPVRI